MADTLRFSLVVSLLHAHELDIVGDELAAAVSRWSGRDIRYVSDSALEYDASCTAAYVPDMKPSEWSVDLMDDGEVASLHVTHRVAAGESAEITVAEAWRTASWLQAIREWPRDAGVVGLLAPLNGIPLIARDPEHQPVILMQRRGRVAPSRQTLENVADLYARCVRWGTMEVILSIAPNGAPARATVRKPWRMPFDPEGARCLQEGLDALSVPARVASRVRLELRAEPGVPFPADLPPFLLPHIESCLGNDVAIDLCVETAMDGSVDHWHAAYARPARPRALGSIELPAIPAHTRRCVARHLEAGFACAERGDSLVLEL